MYVLFTFTVFLCYFVKNVLLVSCHSHYCHEKVELQNETSIKCLLTHVKEECIKLAFGNLSHSPPTGQGVGKVKLIAYTKFLQHFQNKVIALNFSVEDIYFRKLIIQYQHMGDEESSICHQVERFNSSIEPFIDKFYVSCSLSNGVFETYETPYRLLYFISTETYEYSRKLVFTIPRHQNIDFDTNNTKSCVPFIYVDVSDAATLSLFIQPLPKTFNVSYYQVWFINNSTKTVKNVSLSSINQEHIQHNFLVESGIYYFQVTAIHSDCGQYGCINNTSPLISIERVSHRLLIMIISTIWLPPVVFYALFHVCKMYRKKRRRALY